MVQPESHRSVTHKIKRAAILLHGIFGARYDQEMAVGRMREDMVALPAQIGADAATEFRPALREVAEQQ